MTTLNDALIRRLAAARARLAELQAVPSLSEVGVVRRVGDGVATVSGLASTRLDELLVLDSGARAHAVSLEPDAIGVVLLDNETAAAAGTRVRGTGAVVEVPVGDALLGRVVDPLGRPRDGGPPPDAVALWPIERPAPAVIDRAPVSQPLYTGSLAIDAMIPLGRGQRELIIGDRSIGKTSLAIDAILNQRRSDVVCIYAAIGQKLSSVARAIADVRAHGPFERTIFVVAEADDPPGMQWIAPYAACTMAEWFRDRGQHALLVLDDLTRHAAVHRQISLLLRNPPGREAYPGDVFYLHARLLERAAKLSERLGGGSLTALPIAETQAGNISAYIPTNLISITDGQIYLETRLFNEGHKPAINVGLSVSRVGARTQSKAMAAMAERLKLDYAQFLELEIFTRFGQLMDGRTARTIAHGRLIRAMLRQPRLEPQSVAVELAALLAIHDALLDELPEEAVSAFKEGIEEALRAEQPRAVAEIERDGTLGDDSRAALRAWLKARAAALMAKRPDGGRDGTTAPG